MSSSPCSSSIDEPLTSSSTFIPSYPIQSIYSMKYNNVDDENDESGGSLKENFPPMNYYPETTPRHAEGENEYTGMYSNVAMQSNEHFSYSSKSSNENIYRSKYSLFNLDMYNSYYQPFVPQTVGDYDAATRYNTNYGLISYDSSYVTYPSTSVMPTTSFAYMNENYPSTQ